VDRNVRVVHIGHVQGTAARIAVVLAARIAGIASIEDRGRG